MIRPFNLDVPVTSARSAASNFIGAQAVCLHTHSQSPAEFPGVGRCQCMRSRSPGDLPPGTHREGTKLVFVPEIESLFVSLLLLKDEPPTTPGHSPLNMLTVLLSALVTSAAAACPKDILSLRSAFVQSQFDPQLMVGIWYEQAEKDPAQVRCNISRETCREHSADERPRCCSRPGRSFVPNAGLQNERDNGRPRGRLRRFLGPRKATQPPLTRDECRVFRSLWLGSVHDSGVLCARRRRQGALHQGGGTTQSSLQAASARHGSRGCDRPSRAVHSIRHVLLS